MEPGGMRPTDDAMVLDHAQQPDREAVQSLNRHGTEYQNPSADAIDMDSCTQSFIQDLTLEVENNQGQNRPHSDDSNIARFVTFISILCGKFWTRFRKPIKLATIGLVSCLFIAYFVYACYRDFNAAIPLVIVTSLVLSVKLYAVLRDRVGDRIDECCCQHIKRYHRISYKYTRWIAYIGIPLALLAFLAFDTGRNPENLRSAVALSIFMVSLFVSSKHPTRVNWRPVVCGLGLQFILGLFIVRSTYGYMTFKFLGAQVAIFAAYTDHGSKSVFGEKYLDHPVAFKILPVIILFSCVINILYYFGTVQWVIEKFGGLMRVAMETSPVESLNAAASIFLGPLECTIMFRPYISRLTQSELNAIMTAGFSTVAGTVVAAYMEFGAPGEHVIAATIMSAPAALAIAKLQVPETQRPNAEQMIELGSSKDHNVIDAACQGAYASIKLVAVVAVNIIGFLALLAFVDAVISYCGSIVGYPELSFKTICSYVFMPLAYMIGIPWEDAGTVGGLIGSKIFFSEFIAFQQMHSLIINNEILPRTKDITTYLLTGFGSVASIGIYVGALTATVPTRKEEFARTGIRAMIGGNFACFMTASICGLLYEGSVLEFENNIANNFTTTSQYPMVSPNASVF